MWLTDDRIFDTFDEQLEHDRSIPRSVRVIDPYWHTKDRRIMHVTDMKYSHLCNTIRMVRRNFNLTSYRMSMPPIYHSNGDMAQMSIDEEFDRECDRRMRASSIADHSKFMGLVREHTLRLIALRKSLAFERLVAEIMSGERFFV